MTTALDTQTVTKLKTPSLYKVILLNDDYTPMDFVIQVLMELFGKSYAEADQLCKDVHHQGRGVAGVYSKEVAEQKAYETVTVAKSNKHTLKAITEVA